MSEPEWVPLDPGYYAYDPDMGWVRFEQKLDMLFFRLQKEPPLLCREVIDPAENMV